MSKAVKGAYWGFLDSFLGQGLPFIANIYIARILSPDDFGLIGMVAFFIALSQVIVESGFTNSLIRKLDCNEDDFSTIFFTNLIYGIAASVIIIFSADYIALLYREPKIGPIIQVLAVGLIINSSVIVHRVRCIKKIDFKTLTKVSVFSGLLSSILSIVLAHNNFGYWSLVWSLLAKSCIYAFLFWFYSDWRPKFVFHKLIFKEHFKFGSNLLLSSLIETGYKNGYFLFIGKIFSTSTLGQYYKADEIAALPSQQLSGLVSKVSLPVLSGLQNDLEALKRGFATLVSKTMFISFLVMFNLMAISKSLVLTTMGDKWEEASYYLILLSIGVVFYPLHSLNLNLLQVMGRSDLFLKLEIIKKIMALPIFIIGFFWGVKFMLIAAALYSFFMLFVNGFWTKKYLQVSSLAQIQLLLPSLFFCAVIAFLTYCFQFFLSGFGSLTILIVQLFSSLFFLIVFGEIFKQSEYTFLKNEAVKLLAVLNPQK